MSRHQGFIAVLAAIVLATACVPAEAVNVSYAAQEAAIGGWDYAYAGDAAAQGTIGSGGYLDGLWDESASSSAWDGTAPGVGNPGGLGAFTDGSSNYLRIQDPGDPDKHGFPGRDNGAMYFGRGVSTDNELLDNGVTLSFRARVPMEAETCQPLDDWWPGSGSTYYSSGTSLPWPPLMDVDRYGGAGDIIASGGKGAFGIWQSSGLNDEGYEYGKIISFSLSVDDNGHVHSDAFRYTTPPVPVGNGLVMNCLSDLREIKPSTPCELVDVDQDEGELNLLPITEADGELDDWHEFWITIEANTTDGATHLVHVYVDGDTVGVPFLVTAGDAGQQPDFATLDNAMLMGFVGSRQVGAVDVDFFAVKAGVHQAPEPSSFVLLGMAALCGLFLLRKKR